MNKRQLIIDVAKRNGLKKSMVEKSINAALKVIAEKVTEGENVSLLGFGTFSIKERQARNGFNPQTKKAVNIPSKKVIRFKASNTLKIK
jgi:DNA-binding protein HU-beta